MDVVVVTWDALAASAIGCYGNEWVETPTLDGLAAAGVVLDRLLATHPATDLPPWPPIPVSFTAVCEGPAPAWLSEIAPGGAEQVEGETGPTAAPASTGVARLLQAGVKALQNRADGIPLRLWLHGQGVDCPCEPPAGFATLYTEECDERGLPAPDLESEDWRLHPAVYAGAVSLLDHWLGTLVAALRATAGQRPTILIVTALRGVAWRTLARREGSAELMEAHVPGLIYPFGNVPGWKELSGERLRRPAALSDLSATLAEACSGVETPGSWLKQVALPHQSSEVVVRTKAGSALLWNSDWLAIQPAGPDQPLQLFQQPDDAGAVNDLAAQRPEVAERLSERLRPNSARSE